MSHEPTRSALAAAAPIMVELIVPPKVAPKAEPPVAIVPPKPKPVDKPKPKRKPKPVVKPRRQPPEPPPPVLAAATPEPVPVEAPSPRSVPATPPPPAEPPPTPQPAVAAARPAPPPPPVTAPIFNAEYLRNPPPAYPTLSRRLGEEGRVVLRVLVSPAGTAQEVEVRTPSGHARLDAAAREAVQRWRFVPAKRGDDPVAAWVLIPISFRLEG